MAWEKITKRYLRNGKELHTADILKDDQQLTTHRGKDYGYMFLKRT